MLIIKDFDRIEDYQDTVEQWRIFEHNLYKLEKINFNNSSASLSSPFIDGLQDYNTYFRYILDHCLIPRYSPYTLLNLF